MILTVTAGKGGVGKTTVAYNLGAELDGVVVDADLGMGDLPDSRGPDLHDVLAGRANPIEAMRDDGPVKLLPCGRTLAGARAADPAKLVETVRAVEREFGTVIIDSPAGMCSNAAIPLLLGDACILVTQPTRPAIADALRTRELARTLETPLARVVVNRVSPERIGRVDTRREQIASTLGAPVTQIPDSAPLARAQRVGQPLKVTEPNTDARSQLKLLANELRKTLED